MASLVDYVRQMRAAGYRPDDIRARLLSAGYSEHDVDDAFAQSSPAVLQSRTAWLVVGVVVIIGLVIGGFVFFRAPAEPLRADVSLSDRSVPIGGVLGVDAHVVAPRESDVRVVVEIIGSDPQPLFVTGRSVPDVVEEVVSLSVQLPAGVPPGPYRARVVVRAGDEQVQRSLDFAVSPPVAPPVAPVEPPVVNVTVPPEPPAPNETLNVSGPAPPSAPGPSPPVVPVSPPPRAPSTGTNLLSLEDIKAVAASDVDKAVELCREQPAPDACLTAVALAGGSVAVCESVGSAGQRDSCYSGFAIRDGDYSVCPKISQSGLRSACESLKKFSEENP